MDLLVGDFTAELVLTSCFPSLVTVFLKVLLLVALVLVSTYASDDVATQSATVDEDAKKDDKKKGGRGGPFDWFLNFISFCPDADNCGLLKYRMKDCFGCHVDCVFDVFSARKYDGYVCNSQSFCPCTLPVDDDDK